MEWVLMIVFIVAVIYTIGFLAGVRKAGKRKDDVRPMPAEQVQEPQRVGQGHTRSYCMRFRKR